jgi:hypothetical protein
MQYKGRHRRYHGPLGISDEFNDVVLNYVRYIPTSPAPYNPTHGTVFEDVTIMPYQEAPEITEFLDTLKIKRICESKIFDSIVNAIFKRWNPDKTHIIGASSGYDSRIIAKAIQILREINGEEWFGETIFIENGGEGEGFYDIMDALGFDKHCYSWEPDYRFEYFKNIHERFNGICSYPVNQWRDYYVDMGYSPEKIQFITGYGANEVTEAVRLKSKYIRGLNKKVRPKERLRQYFKWHYYHQLAIFRECAETIYPFWDFDFIRTMAGNDTYKVRLSEVLTKKFVSECNHVKKMVTKDVRAAGHRTVRERVVKQLYEWYRSTAFGKGHPTKPTGNIDYNQWWMDLCTASYIEANRIRIQ